LIQHCYETLNLNQLTLLYFWIFSLGRVHSGMNVVKRMGMVETDKNDRPVDDVKILRGGIKM